LSYERRINQGGAIRESQEQFAPDLVLNVTTFAWLCATGTAKADEISIDFTPIKLERDMNPQPLFSLLFNLKLKQCTVQKGKF